MRSPIAPALQFGGDGEEFAAVVFNGVLVAFRVSRLKERSRAAGQHLIHRSTNGGGGNGGVPVVTA